MLWHQGYPIVARATTIYGLGSLLCKSAWCYVMWWLAHFAKVPVSSFFLNWTRVMLTPLRRWREDTLKYHCSVFTQWRAEWKWAPITRGGQLCASFVNSITDGNLPMLQGCLEKSSFCFQMSPTQNGYPDFSASDMHPNYFTNNAGGLVQCVWKKIANWVCAPCI